MREPQFGTASEPRHSEVSSTGSYAGAADPPGLSRERQVAGASAGVGVGVARAGAPREAAERRRGEVTVGLWGLYGGLARHVLW